MKIAFLCTSLAPGRDGVGDYVRQLAAACASRGHACVLVALHDRAVVSRDGHIRQGNEIRFSAALGWTRRAALLTETLRDFDPHWLSWQIVPYGFHPKGILPAGCFALLDAARPWRSQAMLHELWLGLSRTDQLGQRVMGAVQRRRLLAFLSRLNPAVLHTSNSVYRLALLHEGFVADVLPLFGNMPVLPANFRVARAELAAELGGALPAEPRWLGVIFGTLHPQWQPGPTLHWLRAASAHANRRIALVAVGRPGAHGAKRLAEISRIQSDVPVFTVGPQPPEKISRLLRSVDFGIATHPWALIEKSGTTATLLEHGLPVLVPRDDWQPRHGGLSAPRDPLLRRLGDLLPIALADWLEERRAPAALLPTVAEKFLADLAEPVARRALVA